MNKEIYIFGHKNPDTDSICSAIGLAYLKNQMAKMEITSEHMLWGAIDRESKYIPMSGGEANPETAYILDKFAIDHPEIRTDVRRQIKDIDIKKAEPIDENTSIKEAWIEMNSKKTYTVPVVANDGKIKGIITIGDIARKYMDVYDKTTIAQGLITYAELSVLLGGEVVVGDGEEKFVGGKINVAAGNKNSVEAHVWQGDIGIISGNHQTQMELIKRGVRCLIVCGAMEISPDVRAYAQSEKVSIIITKQDAYQVVMLINQGIPVKYIMKTMNEVYSFNTEDFVADIKEDIGRLRFRDFPVLDKEGNFVGMIGKSSLINMDSKRIILVDHNEISQGVFGLFEGEIVEIIDHHKLATIETANPISIINEPVGCSSTIVTNLYRKNKVDIPDDIGGLLCAAIISDTMMFKSPTCTHKDIEAAQKLAEEKNINLQELWTEMLKASSDLSSKTDREIFYQDYKQFDGEGFTFGIGQVLVSSRDEVAKIRKRMSPYMEVALKEEGVDLVGLMITDAVSEETELIFKGAQSRHILGTAFGTTLTEDRIHLVGVVSRKKQVIPQVMAILAK